MSSLPEPIVRRLVRLLQEEELDIYSLTLFLMNRDDMDYFDKKDAAEVKRIFTVLMQDTKHHEELLRLMIELGSGR